jgi:soluble epoxide hydrolase/lipid-phosphate phosphatase
LLSRFINYHPSRLTAVVFLSNGYFPPHAKLDALAVDSVNNATLAYLGYEVLGFWPFFDEADASAVLDGHVCTQDVGIPHR